MSRPTRTAILSIGLLAAATLAIGGCGPRPVRSVSIGGEPWTVYEGSADGMRGLPGFGDADGMLFDMGREVAPSGAAFGMEDVAYPIDIAWFDADGVLVSTATMTACDAAPCPLYHADGPYRWAVEAPAGAFDDIDPGDRLVVD
jgi:uncharacterized membrane protein (UPF0127 family)